jgi:hypothetical protein
MWKIINNFPNYEISDTGLVRRINTQRILVNKIHNSNRYCYVTLYNGSRKSATHQMVHRLVATAFIPNPNNLEMVHHIDNNGFNNNISNLQWVTRIYNCVAERNVRNQSFIAMNIEDKSKAVLQYDRHKNFIRWFKSMSDAARFIQQYYPDTKVDNIRRCIGRSCQHRTRLAYGYKWMLENKIKD